ncbi:MAG: DUF4349 domain-containing protein [Deltaproteobacteria bacterium]|nr:DUF4349 domain-containing protein [Deltaproteobacteria bacterium]
MIRGARGAFSAFLLLSLCAVSAKASAPKVTVSTSLVLKVTDRTQAADDLIKRNEELGGYFSQRQNDYVVLRVPHHALAKVIAMAESLGKVIQKTYNSTDVTFDIEEKRTLVASREAVLARYFKVLDGASLNAIVSIEHEMTQLIADIEQLRGSLNLIEHHVAFADLTVNFQFRERQPPIRDGSSSFAWLNTVNLIDLIEDFRK